MARLRERRVDVEVIVISGHGNIESAVRAIKMGAFDFVEKPLSLEKTILVVRNALRQRQLEAENRALRAHVDRRLVMVGESHAIRQLREQIAMAAPTNGRVLIYGENGTGKELVARSVHALSRRRAGPFIEVNCAAIPEELIESELFGHVKGAFTGAVSDRRGRFEAADGGTIFLDEIADMSLKTQAKVLRVLQEQVVDPVGGTSSVKVDVRVLAATNKDLLAEIRAGRFREDLYFRLSVIPVFVPPLRERDEDVPRLAEHFMAELAREYGRRPKTLRRGGGRGAASLRMARQRARAAEPHRAAADHGVGRPSLARSTCRFSTVTARPATAIRSPRTASVLPLHDARERFERDYILRTLAGAARQHLAHRRRPRRRAQQPLSQDARLRHCALATRERCEPAEPAESSDGALGRDDPGLLPGHSPTRTGRSP